MKYFTRNLLHPLHKKVGRFVYHTYIYIYMCICMHIYMYIYIYVICILGALLPFLGGGFPYYHRLHKTGTLILTSLLENLGTK